MGLRHDCRMHHPERAPHRTAGEAFAEIDHIAEQMHRTGAPTDAVELVVVTVVARPRTATLSSTSASGRNADDRKGARALGRQSSSSKNLRMCADLS